MRQSFASLTQRGRARRLAALARQALEAYSLAGARFSLLDYQFNTTLRVEAPGGELFVLRICHLRRTRKDVVASEVAWLEALRRDTDLRVPEPIPNRDGSFITIAGAEEVLQPRLCVLFRWINGRFLSRSLTPPHLLQVGRFTASLHEHARQWGRPPGFTRLRVDNLNPLHQDRDDAFDPAVAARAVEGVASVGTKQDAAIVAAAIERVWDAMQEFGHGPEAFGLIHGDLHHRNTLFHGGQVGGIDFDDCGFGHWLYDLAVTLSNLGDRPDLPALREALLAGYRQVRPLPEEHESLLDMLLALRTLQDMLWDIDERNQPAFRHRWKARMARSLHLLRRYHVE